jgi:triosephosphate isomerase
MRRKIVAGNWKMNTSLEEGIQLAEEVNKLAEGKISDALVIIAPPFTHLYELKKLLTVVKLSAQNCASEAGGAYTGEISADMIRSAGCEYSIIGHSERRSYFHETDQSLVKKVNLLLSKGIVPIFCIGEVLSEREAGKHFNVVRSQLHGGLFHLDKDDFSRVVIAYEPVWAIGTGVNATPAQAQEMHELIRNTIAEHYSSQIADQISILYGGSCKASNAKELFANPDVDGGLIGGASLKADEFIQIINAFQIS